MDLENITEESARKYCGSYKLVRHFLTGRMYRSNTIPQDYIEVKNAYDSEGYLLPQYWTLERLGIG